MATKIFKMNVIESKSGTLVYESLITFNSLDSLKMELKKLIDADKSVNDQSATWNYNADDESCVSWRYTRKDYNRRIDTWSAEV